MNLPQAPVKILFVSENGLNEQSRELIRKIINKDTRFVAAFGKDCYEIEDFVDDLSEGLDTFITTSSHPDESLEEVSSLIMQLESDSVGEDYSVVRI